MTMSPFGLDNIAIAFALGPLGLGWRRIRLLGIVFGVAEAGMALLGATVGSFIGPSAASTMEAAQATATATIAVALVGLAWIKCRQADIIASPWALVGMSLLLGIDDLIAGSRETPAALASLVATGMLTGLLAAAACAVSSTLFPLARQRGALVSALMLAGLAIAKAA